MGWLLLETLAFDGTRLRANNRRTGTRTPDRLREMKKELAEKFAELEAKTAAADAQEDQVFGDRSAHTLSKELADVERRRPPGERPFAVIKQHFGACRFLLRGMDQVKQEWLWLSSAFNLHRLFGLIRSGVDPPPANQS